MKLFSEQGLAGTSISDIVRESGDTNPALYKHFAGKEELALHLFETCHRRLWAKCHAAILSDGARVLWPKAAPAVRRQTMIGLARSLMSLAPRRPRARSAVHLDVVAASLQGTLAELARMLQVGVIAGPAVRWKADLVALFRRVGA